MPSGLSDDAGWYFRLCGCVRLLRRESPTCGWGGVFPPVWVGGEEGGGKRDCERWAARSATPNSRSKLFSRGDSATVVPLLALAFFLRGGGAS